MSSALGFFLRFAADGGMMAALKRLKPVENGGPMPSQRLSLTFARACIGLLLLIPVATQAQKTTPEKPTGTITGRVTVGERGVPEIMITIQSVERPGQQPLARTRTDTDGYYRIDQLPAGQFQVSVIAPPLVMAEQAGSSSAFFGAGKSVLLAAGETANDVDIKLVRGAVITGRVTDADGKPVVEKRVNLQLIDQSGNPSRQFGVSQWNYQMGTTDDRGIYRIYGLAPGRYRVSVGSDGDIFYQRSHSYYKLTYYGDTGDAAKATVVELQEGSEAANIDIRLGRAANTFVATGRVIDAETGQPIQGVRLGYGSSRPNQPFFPGMLGQRTNSRGEFRIEGLEPGRYGVAISSNFESLNFFSDPLVFEIADTDVTNLELKATQGLTLSGVVAFEGPSAKELQRQMSVLRIGASVSSPTNPQSGNSASSLIAADGTFKIMGLRPGKVRWFLGAWNTPNAALRGVTLLRVERGGADVMQTLELQPGESIADLRLVATLGTGTIRGTVTFVGGELPRNSRLFISTTREGANAPGGTLVDARGRYGISNLISGTYQVTLNVQVMGPASGRPFKPQTRTVTVSDNVETQVDFVVDLTPKEGAP